MKHLTVLAGLLVTAAAIAQSPPDVPDNHWASKAVTDLYRLGVLRGYPDGLYRGNRPASRYELAWALNGFYGVQKTTIDGLSSEISRLRQPQQNVEGLAEIRARLDSLEANVQSLNGLRSDVTSLTSQFGSLTEQLRKIQEDLRIMRNKRQ